MDEYEDDRDSIVNESQILRDSEKTEIYVSFVKDFIQHGKIESYQIESLWSIAYNGAKLHKIQNKLQAEKEHN